MFFPLACQVLPWMAQLIVAKTALLKVRLGNQERCHMADALPAGRHDLVAETLNTRQIGFAWFRAIGRPRCATSICSVDRASSGPFTELRKVVEIRLHGCLEGRKVGCRRIMSPRYVRSASSATSLIQSAADSPESPARLCLECNRGAL